MRKYWVIVEFGAVERARERITMLTTKPTFHQIIGIYHPNPFHLLPSLLSPLSFSPVPTVPLSRRRIINIIYIVINSQMDDDYEMFKIVIIGSTGTGKTNIATRYIRNEFN